MEPVEIDFIYGGNTQTEGKKIEQSMDAITAQAKKAQADVAATAKAQAAVIKQIEADIRNIEKQLSQAAPGNAKMELMQELNAAKRVLDEEKNALAGVNASIEATAQKHTRLRTQVMEAKDALAQMEMAGKRGTAEYTAMAQNLGRLNDQMGDTTAQAKILADDEKGFRAVANGVSGLAGALSAGVGVAALFGAEQEDLVKIQTRLQAVMAITIGIQQVAETLNKDSYFSVVLLTKAKTALAAANLRVAATFGISAAAAKTFMAAITLGLSVAITGIIILFEKLKSKEQEQLAVMRERLDTQLKLQKEISEGYASEVAKVEAARAALSSETVTRKQKFEIIKKLQEQMPGYTAELDSEGRLIRENTSAYNDFLVALEKSLLLRAAEKDLEKLISQKYELQKLKPAPASGNPLGSGLYKPKNAQEQLASNIAPAIDASIAEIDAGIAKIKDYISTNSLIELTKPGKPTGGTKDKKDKEAKEAYDAQKVLADQLLDLRKKTATLEIDVMEDGLQKKLKQINDARDKELAAITEKQQDIVDAYNKSDAGRKNPQTEIKNIPGIDPKTLEAIEAEKLKITGAAEKQRVQAAADANAEIVKLANSYADERTRIALQYDEDITRLEAAGQTAAAAAARAERDRSISDTTAEMITSTELYKTASDDKLQISAETTAKLIEDIKKRIEAEIKAGNLSKEKGKEMLNDLNKTGISSQADKNKNNPFASLIDGLEAYKKAKDKITDAKANGASVEDMAAMEDAANKALSSTAGAAGMAMQAVQSIIGTVVDGLDQLGMLTEEEKETANQVIGMVGGAADLAMGIASGNPVQIIQGSIALIVSGMKLFDQKSRDIEKAQKKHKENIADLERAYNKLQRAVEKALGTDVYAAQRAAIENNKKQIAEYEAWIAEERKKKKKKQDQDAIKDAQDKIQELKNNTEDELNAIAESLAQTNAKSLAGELADAITGAFSNGEDAAKAFGDVANQVMQNAVKNALKLQFLEKPMQSAVDQLAKDMESGGNLSDAEQSAFRKKIEDAGKIYYGQLAQYSDLFTGQNSRSGIKGDVANMSEETGSALTGQITAMRLNVVALLENSKSSLDTIGRMLATLENIKQNTDRLNRIDETLWYMKQNGIKVQ